MKDVKASSLMKMNWKMMIGIAGLVISILALMNGVKNYAETKTTISFGTSISNNSRTVDLGDGWFAEASATHFSAGFDAEGKITNVDSPEQEMFSGAVFISYTFRCLNDNKGVLNLTFMGRTADHEKKFQGDCTDFLEFGLIDLIDETVSKLGHIGPELATMIAGKVFNAIVGLV